MYPVAIGDVMKNAGLVTSVRAGFSFLWAAVRYAAFNRPIRNMKDAYTAQFGSTLYEMFFRRYTEKVWGKPCEELSADWVAQRKGIVHLDGRAASAVHAQEQGPKLDRGVHVSARRIHAHS